ncbi:MAG: hypothetical protein IKU86_11405 [Thermoguttaceae bacterium]|nr:hypothetical protein [Thermoguttaceae bacterium]
MNVWNKVLYVLIAILCVVFSVFAANKYSLTKKWDEKLAKQEAQIQTLKDEIAALKIAIDGDPLKKAESWNDLGLRPQLARVRALLRGDAFVNCLPVEATTAEIDRDPIAQTPVLGAKISFAVTSANSLTAFSDAGAATDSFRQGALAYVFDSGLAYVDEAAEANADAAPAEPVAPRFLGAFKFVGAANSQAALESVGYFSEAELQELQDSQASGRSWIVCVDRLPMDVPTDVASLIAGDAETFASLDETTRAYFEASNPSAQMLETLASVVDANSIVDFQGRLTRQLATRDAENVMKARRSLALASLTRVVVDQLVSIGREVEDETLKSLYTAEDYDAAVARKSVASYEEQKTTLEAALAKMEGYRDLAKSKLDEAQARVAECQTAIETTIAENARLAAVIAQAQIALAENAEQKSKGGDATTAFALSGI